MIKVSEKGTIYVLCPAYVKTGGTELLHQLVFALNGQGIKSVISYFDYKDDEQYTPNDFKKYVDSFTLIEEIQDKSENIIIFPETNVLSLKNFKNAYKVIWWLSVDNYSTYYIFKDRLRAKKGILRKVKGVLSVLKQKILGNNKLYRLADYHLYQCYYAKDFLDKLGIKDNKEYLSDYVNDVFLQGDYDISKKRGYCSLQS